MDSTHTSGTITHSHLPTSATPWKLNTVSRQPYSAIMFRALITVCLTLILAAAELINAAPTHNTSASCRTGNDTVSDVATSVHTVHAATTVTSSGNTLAHTTSAAQASTLQSPIVVYNNKLYDLNTHHRFKVRGVSYGYTLDDDNSEHWLPALHQLVHDVPPLNTIRFYTIDASKSYTQFMQATAALGLYVMVPLTVQQPTYCQLNRAGVPSLQGDVETCYPSCLLTEAQKIVNQFSAFNHTLAYIVGNEVLNSRQAWRAAPCLKAFIKDLKQYQQQCALRSIPLMYTAADNAIDDSDVKLTAEKNNRMKIEYLSCGDAMEQIDMVGINTYRYCADNMDYTTSTYDKLNAGLRGVSVPLLVTEYGCAPFYYKQHGQSIAGSRSFGDVPLLFGLEDRQNPTTVDMGELFDGALAYEYSGRGGEDFALYVGGGLRPDGAVGMSKACKEVGGCEVDNLSQQLQKVIEYETEHTEAEKLPMHINLVATSFAKFSANSDNAIASQRSCPTSPWADIDLSPTTSRFMADGYHKVECPAYTQADVSRGESVRGSQNGDSVIQPLVYHFNASSAPDVLDQQAVSDSSRTALHSQPSSSSSSPIHRSTTATTATEETPDDADRPASDSTEADSNTNSKAKSNQALRTALGYGMAFNALASAGHILFM